MLTRRSYIIVNELQIQVCSLNHNICFTRYTCEEKKKNYMEENENCKEKDEDKKVIKKY